jgi:hypothetical protein
MIPILPGIRAPLPFVRHAIYTPCVSCREGCHMQTPLPGGYAIDIPCVSDRELRNLSLELRNLSLELRNVSLELRNVSLEGLSYRSKAGSRRPQRGPSAAPQTRHSGGCLLRGARGPAPQTGNRMVKPSPFSITISILEATEFQSRNR